MKIFQHCNVEGEATCLICKKPEDKPCILIGVTGTEKGNLMQAQQAHVDCIDLLYYPDYQIIGQKLATAPANQNL